MNIATLLTVNSRKNPNDIAISFPKIQKNGSYTYHNLSFRELETLSNKFARSFLNIGLKKNDRTLIFLKPSLDFHAVVFALFKIGAIPVLIDPGMGKENLLKCITETHPKALIAEREIHYIKLLFPKIFKNIKLNISPKKVFFQNIYSFDQLRSEKIDVFETQSTISDDIAAILFTSGGTGTPKGVIYTHEIFSNQVEILRDLYKLNSKDIDMPGFPLFSLFTIAMGMKSCIPDMDPSKPAKCDPKKIVKNIFDQQPTFVAGSPAIWERVADYCVSKKIILPSIKYVVMFGAPVRTHIHQKFKTILPNGTTYTPYGATEALPICNISGNDILANTAYLTNEGHGTCVGFPVKDINIKIIKSSNIPIFSLEQAEELDTNIVGEIIVSGPIVTKEYMDSPIKTAETKIYDTNGKIWHRMGDVGYLDIKGQLWFCGRKSHQVITKDETMYPIPCEAIFNQHPEVKRSALVGLGIENSQIPAIVIERKDQSFLSGKDRSIFESELLAIAKKYPHTSKIQKIYLSKGFPVDVRHNIKIDRIALKKEIENIENTKAQNGN